MFNRLSLVLLLFGTYAQYSDGCVYTIRKPENVTSTTTTTVPITTTTATTTLTPTTTRAAVTTTTSPTTGTTTTPITTTTHPSTANDNVYYCPPCIEDKDTTTQHEKACCTRPTEAPTTTATTTTTITTTITTTTAASTTTSDSSNTLEECLLRVKPSPLTTPGVPSTNENEPSTTITKENAASPATTTTARATITASTTSGHTSATTKPSTPSTPSTPVTTPSTTPTTTVNVTSSTGGSSTTNATSATSKAIIASTSTTSGPSSESTTTGTTTTAPITTTTGTTTTATITTTTTSPSSTPMEKEMPPTSTPVPTTIKEHIPNVSTTGSTERTSEMPHTTTAEKFFTTVVTSSRSALTTTTTAEDEEVIIDSDTTTDMDDETTYETTGIDDGTNGTAPQLFTSEDFDTTHTLSGRRKKRSTAAVPPCYRASDFTTPKPPATKPTTKATPKTTPKKTTPKATTPKKTTPKTTTPKKQITKATTKATQKPTTKKVTTKPPTKATQPTPKAPTSPSTATTPSTKGSTPPTKASTPLTKASTPSTKSTTPSTKDSPPPSTKGSTPSTKASTPSTKASTPSTKVSTPSTKHSLPAVPTTTTKQSVPNVSKVPTTDTTTEKTSSKPAPTFTTVTPNAANPVSTATKASTTMETTSKNTITSSKATKSTTLKQPPTSPTSPISLPNDDKPIIDGGNGGANPGDKEKTKSTVQSTTSSFAPTTESNVTTVPPKDAEATTTNGTTGTITTSLKTTSITPSSPVFPARTSEPTVSTSTATQRTEETATNKTTETGTSTSGITESTQTSTQTATVTSTTDKTTTVTQTNTNEPTTAKTTATDTIEDETTSSPSSSTRISTTGSTSTTADVPPSSLGKSISGAVSSTSTLSKQETTEQTHTGTASTHSATPGTTDVLSSSTSEATTATITTTERTTTTESPAPSSSSTDTTRSPTTTASETNSTASSTSTNPVLVTSSTTPDATTGEDKSSSTVVVDTTPMIPLQKESSSSVTSTVLSTTSSTEAARTTTVTTSTKGKDDTPMDISSTTPTTLKVTDAQTNITENTSTEKRETLSSSTTEKETAQEVTTQKTSTTTAEEETKTTTTEISTSAKQAYTSRKMSTTPQASSTVSRDATATEPTTKDLKTTEKATTTADFATTTTLSGKTVTPTTASYETEDKLTATMQQTTNLDLSSPKEQETLASTKGWTMGESKQPESSGPTGKTESGTTGKTSEGYIGTTTQQTTNDVHSESTSSHTTESRRPTDHFSPEHPTTNATGTTGVTHQETTAEKKTVTTQPEKGQTVRTSEGMVDISESGETTTTANGQPVEHFTDINVGDDESSTTVPDYCSLPCPNGFSEGANYCYMIPPKEKSTTYTMAISFCQMVSGPRSDLATSYDYQDNDNLELFKNMTNELDRSTDQFFVNMLASADFRKNLKADIVSLSQLSRFDLHVIKSVGSSQAIADVNSICRTTKFCKPNTCSFKQFTDLNKEEVVGLPNRKELTAGESIVVRCIQYNTSQVHTIACAETGSFKVHPSMVNCIAPADFQEDDPSTPLDPLHPESCELCSDVGTASCSKNTNGTGVVCHCKDGWTKRTCWKSPDLCTSETCGEHGQCVSLVDRTECVCEYGMIGERCTVNATKTSWFGTNETLAIWDVRSLGVAAQASSTFVVIGLKFLSKILIVGECEDPQDTYQDYRHALHSIGNLAAVFFTHPDMFGVDAIGCRFFFWMITVCYTLGLVFWVNESINVYTTVRAVHRNTWNKNFAGEDKKYLRFAPRVIVPFLIGVLAILLVCANSWNTVGTSWSCFGSFSSDATSTWYPLCAGNAALALLAVSFAEATSLLIKNRPHTLVRLHNWFNLNQPANFEIVGKVERNRYFTAIGPILHFLTWATLTVASDKNTSFMDSMSFLLGMTYAGFNFVQMVFTSPAYYAWACIGAMIILPEKWSPTFEWTNLRNREEVLARYYKRRYKKEQDRKILDEDERKANEQREVDETNAKLLQKYPNLPSTLLFHCPEEPPVLTLPRPFPFDPTGKEYMTTFQREHLARIWTRSYLETRKFHKKSPEKSAFEVVKKEIQRNIFQVKTEDRKKQELFALAQWWNSVPAMDRTKLREHKNTVIMEDENEDDMLAFEREVSRLASIIDLRENRKRKGLLKDKETDPFQKAADFLKFEPAEPIKCVLFETVDGLGDVRPRKFLKKPPIVLKRQIDEYDKAYSHGVAELNKPFDKTYDDDLMVTQWSDTEHSEAVKEIMNVSPSQIGEQPISMNPRKRPLDEFWFDHERPDFVGPREKHEIPIGPYEEYARKCHYYQSLTDAQWSQIEHNSYHMANLRKIRRGEL